ncbi:MAG: hypothetical protein Kow006_22670 [Gammaproteobacteria bacterium]
MTSTPDCPNNQRTDPPRIDSEQLLGKRSRIVIVHEGEEYQLSKTSRGKLILTK